MPIGFETSGHPYLKRSVKVALILVNEPHRLISAHLFKTQLAQKASCINQDVKRKPKDVTALSRHKIFLHVCVMCIYVVYFTDC